MVEWAKAAGFTTESVTDATNGTLVTVANLRARIMPLLTNVEDVIDHFIFHFAGHGFGREAEDQFLLLSQWRERPNEAIRISRFVRLLQFYQPARVSLFIDACRGPSDAEVEGSGVLDRPEEEAVEFLEDRFRASVAGKQTYMIRDKASGEAYCLFSSVLLKVLSGKYPEAIDMRGAEKVVTSAKIYGAMKKHLPIEAARYHVDLEPSLKPSFVAPNDVYTHLPLAFEPPDLPIPSFRLPSDETPPPVLDREWETSYIARQNADHFKKAYALEQRPTHFETGAGLAVIGEDREAPIVVPIVTPPSRVEFDNHVENGTWWRLAGPQFTLTAPSNEAPPQTDEV
jgi:hypothetical protein